MSKPQLIYRLPFRRPHVHQRCPLDMLVREVRVHGEIPPSFLHQLEDMLYQMVLYEVVSGTSVEEIQEFIRAQPQLDFPMAWEVVHFANCQIKWWQLQQRQRRQERGSPWPQQQEQEAQLRLIMTRALGSFDDQRFYAVASAGQDILGVTPSGGAAGVVALHGLHNPPRHIKCFLAFEKP